MKKLILLALTVGSIATAQAQKAGSILVYGDVGIKSKSTTNDDGIVGTNNPEAIDLKLRFTPGVGYQFNDWWTVGMNFGVSYHKTNEDKDNPSSPEYRERTLLVGPFIRMTMPLSRTFFVFHQFNIAYLDGKRTEDNPTPVSDRVWDSQGFLANIVPAIGVNVSKCIALNFSVGGLQYLRTKETNNFDASETTRSNFGFTLGRQVNIGVSANLGGKRHVGHREPGMEHRRHMDMDNDDDMEIKVKKKKVKIEEED